MARSFDFDYNDRTYTVEFDRKSFVDIERMGFKFDEVAIRPMLNTETLLRVGLRNHHTNISEKIFKDITDYFVDNYDVSDFIEYAAEEYRSFMTTTQPNSEKKKLNINQR